METQVEIPYESGLFWQSWSATKARLLLIAATVLCLIPFVGKAFNFDDPLFIWVAKHLVRQPFDPYNFPVVWYFFEMPMSAVTKNPPLASYYAALIGPWTHWSEVSLHLAFLLPAVVVILATYELAGEFTRRPLLASVLTLASPVFLVSATSVMCDVPMLALWMLSVLVWHKTLSFSRPLYFVLGSFLVTLCILTKYFGACLIPLLALYSFLKHRNLASCLLPFLLPAGIMIAYQVWSRALYGEGLLLSAAQYAQFTHSEISPHLLAGLLVGLSFAGGCMLPALLMSPLLFRKTWLARGLAVAGFAVIAVARNWVESSPRIRDKTWVCVQLILFIAGGIFILALAVSDVWRRRDADSALLSAWVLGTFVFAAFLNWTVNARSVLPLVPATAILIARRLDHVGESRSPVPWIVALPVLTSVTISLWLASADVALANSAREAALIVRAKTESASGMVFFSGHWGFQYYMEAQGAHPVDIRKKNDIHSSDIIVQPENNTNLFAFPPDIIASSEAFEIPINHWVSTSCQEMGAGFYSGVFGPLPFAFGRVPPEGYSILHLRILPSRL